MHTIKKYVKDMKAIPNTKSLYQSLTKKSNSNKRLKKQHKHLLLKNKILSDYCYMALAIATIILLIIATFDYLLRHSFNIYVWSWISTNVAFLIRTSNDSTK